MIRRFLIASAMGSLVHVSVLAQDMTVTFNIHDGKRISRSDVIRFTLTRPLIPQVEKVAVVIGNVDVTSLLTSNGSEFAYRPEVFSLPTGESVLVVYLVTGDSTWTEIGKYTMHVLHPGGFDRLNFDPSLSLANKGQLAEDHSANGVAPPRRTFQEVTGQLQLKGDLQHDDLLLSANATIVGVSFRPDALRFGEKRESAPKYDLAGYLTEIQVGRTKVSVGQIVHGRERHLLSGFSSRGIGFSSAVGSFLDVSAAVMNGTSIAGWDNVLGLRDPRHRIYSGTLGLEFLPEHPGVARVEASAMTGSLLPLNSFNSAGINDAEQSRGYSFRILLADAGRRIQVDAGIARSRFTNPADPFLAQSVTVVPVEPVSRQAYYADASLDVLQGVTLGNSFPASLIVGFRHERVDPLYRSVGTFVQSDRLQDNVDVRGGIGPVQFNVAVGQSEDNLDNIPSVLKSKTRRMDAGLSSGLLRTTFPSLDFLPSISYGFSRTHQFGLSVPTNSNFDLSRVPDQIVTSHAFTSEWLIGTTRLAYRFGFALQDNQQIGHETADIVNRSNAVSISVAPVSIITVNLDAAIETAENKEFGRTQSTQRLGTLMGIRPLAAVALNVSATVTNSTDDPRTNRQRSSSLSLDGSYGFDFSPDLVVNWNGQVFVRYALNEFHFENSSFGASSVNRAWSVTTGVNFNIFPK